MVGQKSLRPPTKEVAMLFPDNALFEYVLIDLAEAIARRPIPPIVRIRRSTSD